MGVLVWIVGLVLSAGFVLSGVGKLMGVDMLEQARVRLGVGERRWRVIGELEILGAAGVIIGLFTDGSGWEAVGVLAALGLIALMVGALIHHVRVGDPPQETVAAVVMVILAVLYLVFLGGR